MCALVALTACGTGVKQSVRTPVEMGERIELKTPDPKMGLTINEALAARSSSRDFSPEMLSLEELSGVLWAAAGVNREDGHLTAPSAMALYPIRVYAFLPEGVYRYDSKANVLNRVIEGDRRELTAMQDFAYTAPLNLVYVADYSVYADRNQPVDRIRFWCAADAGGYTENVNLYAAGNGLKAITRGSFKEEALLELLGLDPAQYGVILAQTVGRDNGDVSGLVALVGQGKRGVGFGAAVADIKLGRLLNAQMVFGREPHHGRTPFPCSHSHVMCHSLCDALCKSQCGRRRRDGLQS